MKKIRNWSIAGGVFTSVAGGLLHFVYGWLGGGLWAAVGAVNESTWEHLKLLFWPVIVFGLIEYLFYGRKTAGFIPVKVISALLGMAVIVTVFYTYQGILGYHVAAVDISLFFLGTAAAYWFSCKRLTELPSKGVYRSPFAATCFGAAAAALAILFILFTYSPPQIGLFQDPVTGGYGL